MIAAYQRFYEVEEIDEGRNRTFFSRFLAPSEGVGRALIEASATIARERGTHHLQWVTAPDNETARRLYDKTGASAEASIEYELPLD